MTLVFLLPPHHYISGIELFSNEFFGERFIYFIGMKTLFTALVQTRQSTRAQAKPE